MSLYREHAANSILEIEKLKKGPFSNNPKSVLNKKFSDVGSFNTWFYEHTKEFTIQHITINQVPR